MRLFDFEEERVKQEILRIGAKRVLIQLPEGLKPEAQRLAKTVERLGALPLISADPCYGACDLATSEAESLGADLVIHYGHSKLARYEQIAVLYVEARATIDVSDVVAEAIPLLEKWRRIGLVTTVQHVQAIDGARKLLLRAKKTVVIGDARRLSYPGQVIGCDYGNAKSISEEVEAFLFIGGGRFHAMGVALSTSRPTIVADPYAEQAFSVNDEAEKVVKQRWALVEEAKEAKTFAVLVGLKPGQKRLEQALNVKHRLEDKAKTAFVFAIREITPDALSEFPMVEAYVNTACPRISIDDASRFKKPLLTINEALVSIGEMTWEELCRKGLLENWI